MGVRPGTITSSVMVPPRVQLAFSSSYTFHQIPHMNSLKLQFNASNLTNARSWSTIAAGDASTYTGYPTAPRMFFGTVSAAFCTQNIPSPVSPGKGFRNPPLTA